MQLIADSEYMADSVVDIWCNSGCIKMTIMLVKCLPIYSAVHF